MTPPAVVPETALDPALGWRRPEVAWSAFALTAVMAGAQAWYVLSSGTPLLSYADEGLNSFPLITLGAVLGAAVGAVVASRHPSNPVGWLFCAGMLGTAVGLAAEAFATAVETYGGPGPDGLLKPAIITSYVLGAQWSVSLLALTFLVFPDGSLPSRRWRWVLRAMPVPLVVSTVTLVAYAAGHDVSVDQSADDVSPVVAIPLGIAWLALAVLLLLATVSLVRRVRRTTGVVHQQLRWLSTASVALLVGLMVALFAPDPAPGHTWTWILYLPLFLAFTGVPIAAGVAMLRYRLYDIDIVISRAVLLAVLLAFATAGYVAVVVTVGALLGHQTGERFWLSLLATAVVAMAFQPLRRRVVRLADRLAYGERAAPYDALSAFSRRLGESPAPSSLLPAVAEAAGRAVSASSCEARLELASGPAETAVWTAGHRPQPDRGGGVTVAVADRSGPLGSLAVTPAPGRAVRPHELALLADIAEHAAVAFRNARLQAELEAQVGVLAERTAELAASRRRLYEAGDAERRRLERSIEREVMPTLRSLTASLDLAADGSADSVDTESLVTQATTALDALRELTRGIFPTLLTRAGLAPALRSHLARLDLAGVLQVDASAEGRRFAPRTEAAAYFCCTAAVAAGRRPAERISLSVDGARLLLEITGAMHAGPDVAAMVDRVDALGGSLRGTPEGLLVTLPVDDEAETRLPLARGAEPVGSDA